MKISKLKMSACLMNHIHRTLLGHKIIPASSHCYQRKRFLVTTSSNNHIKPDFLHVSEEVKEALASNKAVVALESTIITHGMPYPHNFSTALCVERRVRENGAVPATVAVIKGKLCVGLSDTDIIWLAEKSSRLTKISRRDMAFVLSQGGSGGTTVSATMIAAHMAGIPIFATGGIGGVHRGAETSFDVSADLTELGRTPVAVVSSGVKSILDIPKTLEYLETEGVFVAAFSDKKQFPAFFTRDSGHLAPYNVGSHLEAAQVIESQLRLGLHSGMLFAVPIPVEIGPAGETIEAAITQALSLAEEKNIRGKEVTPFVLSMVNQLTQGESLVANIALVENNASVAGGMANCLAQLRAGVPPESVAPPPHSSSFSLLQPSPSPALASAMSSAAGRSGRSPAPGSDSDSSGSSSDGDGSTSSSRTNSSDKTLQGRPVVMGATIVDLTVRVNDSNFKMNGATYPGKVSQSFGGVGRNLADCLSRLGCQPVFVSAVGRDGGLEGCRHMDVSMIQRLDDQSTATYCPVLQADGHLLFGIGDMDINSVFDVGKVEGLDEAIRSAPVVMIDGNFSPDVIQAVASKCAQYSVPVWYEPTDLFKARKPFLTDAWKSLSIVSPNLNELLTMHGSLMTALGQTVEEDLTTEESASRDTVLTACVKMCRDLVPYIPVVLVTLGRHGLLLCHNLGPDTTHVLPLPSSASSQNHIPTFHAVHYPTLSDGDAAKITSVSGAGDCLAATLLAAMLDGHPMDSCVRLALLSAELSLASAHAVPDTISRETVLDRPSSEEFPQWKPRVLSV